jgi:hypothetical protein
MQTLAVLFALALAQGEPTAAAGAPPVADAKAEPATTPPATVPAPAPAAPVVLRLPAGTELSVELVDALSSKTSTLSQRFAIRLAKPISADGVEVVPAGAAGEGEVIDVGKAGFSGKAGKLIVSARFLELNGKRVRVRGLTLAKGGESRVNDGVALGITAGAAGAVVGMLIKGGDIEMPTGTAGSVRLAEDVELSVTPPAKTSSESKGD